MSTSKIGVKVTACGLSVYWYEYRTALENWERCLVKWYEVMSNRTKPFDAGEFKSTYKVERFSTS